LNKLELAKIVGGICDMDKGSDNATDIQLCGKPNSEEEAFVGLHSETSTIESHSHTNIKVTEDLTLALSVQFPSVDDFNKDQTPRRIAVAKYLREWNKKQ
jgi:hypothetical protein